METPMSLRLGKVGTKVQQAARRTGFKKTDIIKLAITELLNAYPSDAKLASAVMEYRLKEAAKS